MDTNLFHMLDGDNLYFKLLSLDDAIAIHRFASDERVAKYIGWNLTHNLEETLELIEGMIKKESTGTSLYASIVHKQTDKVIGTCMFFNFNMEAKHAEIGYVLSASYWDKGYGSEIVRIMHDYGLEYLELHKLHARVVDVNIGSSKVLEKNGFSLEGRLKDYFFIDDKYYDGLLFGKILS